MDPFNGGEISPGPEVQTDEEILDWVRRDGETALHPSCSAKMGPASDPMAEFVNNVSPRYGKFTCS